jgi:hypothetical protein
MKHLVVWWNVTDVLGECAPTIFRVEEGYFPEDGSSIFFHNFSNNLPGYIMSYFRRQ